MICPASPEACTTATTCAARCRLWLGPTPLDFVLEGVHPLTHFVGFRDPQRYENATRVFGPPDVIHHVWDQRAQREIAYRLDTVVFAKYDPDQPPSPYNHDDSNEADDPARRASRSIPTTDTVADGGRSRAIRCFRTEI